MRDSGFYHLPSTRGGASIFFIICRVIWHESASIFGRVSATIFGTVQSLMTYVVNHTRSGSADGSLASSSALRKGHDGDK